MIASNLEKIRTEIQLKNTSNKRSASRTRRSVLAVPGIKKSVKILTPKSINETEVTRRQIKKVDCTKKKEGYCEKKNKKKNKNYV